MEQQLIVLDEVVSKFIPILRKHVKFVNKKQFFPMEADLVEELGLDSLAAINLLLDLEDAFGIHFPEFLLTENTFRSAKTLQSAVQFLVNNKSRCDSQSR